jgi:DNA excision repair protein ERCC-2
MLQAIGRMIRTETDRGMAVILDSRMSKYAKQFDAVLSKDPVADAVEFFDKQ